MIKFNFTEIMDNLIFQNPATLFALFLLVFLDALTGVFKSKRKGISTRSQGFRNTVYKITFYGIAILVVCILMNLVKISPKFEDYYAELTIFLDTFGLALVGIEVKSILENLIVANTNEAGERNDFAKLLIPIHNALILKFSNEFNYHETKEDIINKMNRNE